MTGQIPVVYTDRHRLHATDHVLVEGHPLVLYEVPARAEAILSAVQAARLGPVVEPTDHGLGPILAVHNTDYVEFLSTVHAASAAYWGQPDPVLPATFAGRHAARRPNSFLGLKGYYAFGSGSPILADTWLAAYWSAQCALTAADLVRNGKRVAYALCRPPGHHAAADLYGGYCYLNNAAIGVRYLQGLRGPGTPRMPGPLIKTAILDVDYHHGNGTQLIFYSDPSVLYCSIHVHPDEDYPYYWGDAAEIGAGPGQGTNHNWPLPRGSGDVQYLAVLEEALAVIGEFSPDYLVVSVGFDLVEGDPEGGFRVSTGGLSEIGRQIARLSLPTLLVQEGGYRLDRLGADAVAFLQAFIAEP